VMDLSGIKRNDFKTKEEFKYVKKTTNKIFFSSAYFSVLYWLSTI
jgi:hypothetical protein